MKYSSLVILLLAAPAVSAAPPPAKPNIIFLLSDDLGWADLSCYGSRFHESPNLDKLAAEGMRFTQAYSSSPYCSPSRAAIMTGRYPARLKLTDYIPGNGKSGKFLPAEMKMELPLEEVTIAEVLKSAGYATWHVGKWHLGDVGFYPQNQGFDVNIAGHAGGLPPSYFWPYGMDKKPDPNNYHSRGVPGLEDGKPGEHLCDRLTSEAMKLIEQRKPDQPFFLNLAFYDVHIPAMAKPELVTKYQAKAAKLGLPNVKSAPTYDEGSVARGSDRPPKLLEQQVNATYAAMIETMDTNVGRLLAKLRELGLADNTIILFTSDNGGHFITSNRPLRGCKGWLYEGGVREPCFVRWPGVTKPGSTCDVPFINTDFFPTLLEAAGLPARPDLHRDGVSIVPLLKGETKPLHEALFWHYPHYGNHGNGPCSSVRVGDWKLLEWLEDGSVELFNLAADLGEKQNIAAQNPQLVKELQHRLNSWRRDTAANMPRPKS